jgi:hypothetical protein
MVSEHSQPELLAEVNADIDVHRVLWIAVQLRAVWAVAEVFRDEPELVKKVVHRGLLEQPKDSHSYDFTAKGCEELGRWFERVYPRREEPGFGENWKRVTGRDF